MNINSFIPPKWRKPSLLLNFFIDYIHRNFTFNSKDNKLFIRPCVVFVPPAELNYKSCFHIFKFNCAQHWFGFSGVECYQQYYLLFNLVLCLYSVSAFLSPPKTKPFNVIRNSYTCAKIEMVDRY